MTRKGLQQVVRTTTATLEPLRDPAEATSMATYMKFVATNLGD